MSVIVLLLTLSFPVDGSQPLQELPAESSSQYQEPGTEQESDTGNTVTAESPPAAIPETPVANDPARRPEQGDPTFDANGEPNGKRSVERDETSLAWAAVWLSLFAALLTAGQLVAAFVNLRISANNARATAIAAAATRSQAQAAINVARPFLIVSDVSMARVEIESGLEGGSTRNTGNEFYECTITVTNHGRTPAIVTRWSQHSAVLKTLPPEPIYRPCEIRGLVVAPGQSCFVGPGDPFFSRVTPEQRAAIARGQASRWIWGHIQYRDCFNGVCDSGFGGKWNEKIVIDDVTMGSEGFGQGDVPGAYEYNRYKQDESGAYPPPVTPSRVVYTHHL